MLGDACGDCAIVVGDGCLPCPNGSDFLECAGCIDGARPERSDMTRDIVVPVVVGVITTLAIALITTRLILPAKTPR